MPGAATYRTEDKQANAAQVAILMLLKFLLKFGVAGEDNRD